MNASNVDSKPKVRKETKNKIKVDFERTSFKERFKAKFLTLNFAKKVAWAIIRYILLISAHTTFLTNVSVKYLALKRSLKEVLSKSTFILFLVSLRTLGLLSTLEAFILFYLLISFSDRRCRLKAPLSIHRVSQ